MKRFEFMIRGAATALVGFGVLAICPVAQAQSVNVNSTPVCSSAPALTMTPSGDLNITCTPVGTGGGSTPIAPSCTVPTVVVTIPAGATTISSATIGAACSGNPSPTYAWTNTDATPGFTTLTGASITGGPLAAGTYHFSVVATNSAGTAPSAAGILTVNPPPAGGGTPGCATGPTSAVFAGSFSGDHPTINVGSFASYVLPTFPAANNTYMNFTAVESNNTISGLRIEYTVSPCVGDFSSTSIPAFCTAFGTANSGIVLNAFEGNTATTNGVSVCVLQPNTQYYLNVRTAKPDGTNSCPAGSCSLYVQYHPLGY